MSLADATQVDELDVRIRVHKKSQAAWAVAMRERHQRLKERREELERILGSAGASAAGGGGGGGGSPSAGGPSSGGVEAIRAHGKPGVAAAGSCPGAGTGGAGAADPAEVAHRCRALRESEESMGSSVAYGEHITAAERTRRDTAKEQAAKAKATAEYQRHMEIVEAEAAAEAAAKARVLGQRQQQQLSPARPRKQNVAAAKIGQAAAGTMTKMLKGPVMQLFIRTTTGVMAISLYFADIISDVQVVQLLW